MSTYSTTDTDAMMMGEGSKRVIDAKLSRPITLSIYESNTDSAEVLTFTRFSDLAEWVNYDVNCYVASRAIVQEKLNGYIIDILRGLVSTRCFSINIRPYPGATEEVEGYGAYTSYVITGA